MIYIMRITATVRGCRIIYHLIKSADNLSITDCCGPSIHLRVIKVLLWPRGSVTAHNLASSVQSCWQVGCCLAGLLAVFVLLGIKQLKTLCRLFDSYSPEAVLKQRRVKRHTLNTRTHTHTQTHSSSLDHQFFSVLIRVTGKVQSAPV